MRPMKSGKNKLKGKSGRNTLSGKSGRPKAK